MHRRLPTSPSYSRGALLALVALVVLLLASCTRGSSDMPRGWGPITRHDDAPCPDLTGRYVYAGQPIAWELAGRHVPWDSVPAELDFFEVTSSSDSALRVTIGYADGRQHDFTMVQGNGEPFSGNYNCRDGWLSFDDDMISDRFDAEVESDEFHARRRTMRVARGRNGALVSRLDRTDYDEFTVWCGDGCKGIPLPWTFTTRSTWSRADAWAPGTPRPDVTPYQLRERVEESEAMRLRNERILREEQRLENGTP